MSEQRDEKLTKIWQNSFISAFYDNQRPELLFDVTSIFHPAFCADRDFRITGWSKAFEDLFGIPNGADIFMFFRRFDMKIYDPKTDKVNESLHAVDAMRKSLAETGMVKQLPVILRINGLYEFIEISCVIQKPYDGLQGIMPVSKAMRVMRELRDQEQLFSTSLVHDFNSPLSGLSLRLELLLCNSQNYSISTEVQSGLREMLGTVISLKTSLSLYRSYPDKDALTAFDPIFVMNRFLPLAKVLAPQIVFDDAGHQLRSESGIYLANGTAFWFQRALQNMIKNSVEAIHHQHGNDTNLGKIEVCSDRKGESTISISITDNGCGMSADKLKELNNVGYSSKSGADHQGVGLSIMRQVAAMAGNNEPKFSSEENKGTTVEILLSVERNMSNA